MFIQKRLQKMRKNPSLNSLMSPSIHPFNPMAFRKEAHTKIVQELDDRISCLEDTLLCHILSFLSTREAVRTSALSKRWKYVWSRTPVLDFSEQHCTPNFVSRVLILNNVSHLKKLHFNHLLEFDLIHIQAWISYLILRNIDEVSLCNRIEDRPLDFLVKFLTRVELVILNLSGGTISELPTLVKYSNLKVLHLTDIESPNNNLNRLVSGCPVLEELSIRNCGWSCVDIKSSTLKRLTVCYLVDSTNELLVRAPNLEYVSLSCLKVCSWYFSVMKCLMKARISHFSAPLPLLRIFSGVKSLCLMNSPWIEDTVIKSMVCNRIVFGILTNLELEVTQDALTVMPEILKCSPNLVRFVFTKGLSCLVGEAESCDPPEGKWITPSFVLKCFSCLKIIEISYFEECEGYLDMVGYFLKKAEVLKEMKLTVTEMGSVEEIRLQRKLLLLPRASVTCRVRMCHPFED